MRRQWKIYGLDFKKKHDDTKITEKQSKLTFNSIDKSYTHYDNHTFKQNQVFMDQPIYLGFNVKEKLETLLYQTTFDNLKPCFGEQNIQLHYMDTGSFLLSVKTNDINEDLQSFNELFDFSNLKANPNQKYFSKETKKVLGRFKMKSPKMFLDR